MACEVPLPGAGPSFGREPDGPTVETVETVERSDGVDTSKAQAHVKPKLRPRARRSDGREAKRGAWGTKAKPELRSGALRLGKRLRHPWLRLVSAPRAANEADGESQG